MNCFCFHFKSNKSRDIQETKLHTTVSENNIHQNQMTKQMLAIEQWRKGDLDYFEMRRVCG